MIEYYKIKTLDSLFYINDEGLVCQEEWKGIPKNEDKYQISTLGRIKSLARIAIRKNSGNYIKKTIILNQKIYKENPYTHVNIYGNKNKKYSVHQLMAVTFLNHTPCAYKLVVDHKNNIKTDNRLSNIQVVTNRVNTTKEREKETLGLSWIERLKKWQCSIVINRKDIYLGTFKEKEAGAMFYVLAVENSDKYDGNNRKFRTLIKGLLK